MSVCVCPKCDSTRTAVVWHGPIRALVLCMRFKEHLHWFCKRCGYTWVAGKRTL